METMVVVALAVWNLALSVIMGLTSVVYKQTQEKLKDQGEEVMRLNILLNKTREEVARENVTQAEIDKIMVHIDQRFNKLEEKIDRLLGSK